MRSDASASLTDWLVFYERLRMPLQAMQWAIYPGMVLLAVLALALEAPCDVATFRQWCVIAGMTWLGIALHARVWLRRPLDQVTAPRLLLELKAVYAFEGMVWGYLPWLTLNSCSSLESALSLATNAGVAAIRMMLLSSVPEVFLVYILLGAAVWVVKGFALNGQPLYSLGVVGMLYVITLILQARVHARMLENSIRLRFENSTLLNQLNAQISLADEARREAEAANKAKSKFLAAASHDLRQPAHAQGLYLDILARTALDERQRDLLDNVRALAGASAGMLETLLDYSRIEAGAIVPREQIFALQPLLHQMEREFGPQADAKELLYRTRETTLATRSDPKLVEMILRNLVANALRYTERGGVLVTCRRRQGGIELAVWDTGIGIAADQQAAVFQEFLQLGNPERDRRKGFGLGLAIVAGLARRLEHRLGLRSSPGRGSVFTLQLPLADVRLATASTPQPMPLPQRGVHVLVVDDDEAVRHGMRDLLESWGYGCATAEGLDDALASARQRCPDVLVTDYRLRGEQTGLAVIATLRAQLGQPLTALLITGDTSHERLREAYCSNIPVLHKPVTPGILQQTLHRILQPPPVPLV